MPAFRPHQSKLAPLVGLAVLCGALLVGTVSSHAEERSRPRTPIVVETDNFRIVSYEGYAAARSAADACESLRGQLFKYWLSNSSPGKWSPKCHVMLFDRDADYFTEIGSQGRSTRASSLVDERKGKIVGRRIDVRTSFTDWQTASLAHELTHVIIAERFVGKSLPRWADEGMAILADPMDKRGRHLAELHEAAARRQSFRMVELIELEDYPAAHRWGTFYGQSASLVAHLVERGTPAKFIEFIELCGTVGPATAMNRVYGIESLASCEASWQAELRAQPNTLAERRTICSLVPPPQQQAPRTTTRAETVSMTGPRKSSL